jgi:hypothetical protein
MTLAWVRHQNTRKALSCLTKKIRKQNISHVVGKLQTLSQHLEKLLFTTGGAISWNKSFWYLTWDWKSDNPKLGNNFSGLHILDAN